MCVHILRQFTCVYTRTNIVHACSSIDFITLDHMHSCYVFVSL